MLISNPGAGSVSDRTKEVIVKALQADFKLEVCDTAARDHAMELAEEAVDRDFDAVLAFGGDGTINEVLQPLVGSGVALGFLPGGSTNVAARALRVPLDPVEATSYMAHRIRTGAKRRVGVGSYDGRHFLFSAGFGLDAEVVKRVEAHLAATGRKSDWTFIRNAIKAASTEYLRIDPWLRVETDDAEPLEGVLAVACNAWPFTYFRHFPVDACPHARLEEPGLHLLVLKRVTVATIPRLAWSLFFSRSHISWNKVAYVEGLERARLTADGPHPVQVDGDYIGTSVRAELAHVPDSLDLLA